MTSTNNSLDAEYTAMRRRMSRLRVNCGKKTSLEAEDAASGGDDPGFKELIKYWKKHGIPIPKDLVSDMSDSHVRGAVAKGKGRRRSRELEDLHFCASTGKFNLEKLTIPEDEEVKGGQKKTVTAHKPNRPSLKNKSTSKSNLHAGSHPTKKLSRTQSNFK